MSGHRHCIVLQGTADETGIHAQRMVSSIHPDQVLWISDTDDIGDQICVPPTSVKRYLGRSYDIVVLSLHHALNPDIIGQCQGFVRGNGYLILRLQPEGTYPQDGARRMTAWPYTETDVAHRFYEHFKRAIARSPWRLHTGPITPLNIVPYPIRGTDEQTECIRQLTQFLTAKRLGYQVILADRGRGKSAALGQALRWSRQIKPLKVLVTAGQQLSVDEILRFAQRGQEDAPGYIDPSTLLSQRPSADAIIVDEAAQIPVPLLQRLVRAYPNTPMAFATTTRGYEGTGRGFVLRFLEWLEQVGPPVQHHRLEAPIRWSAGDPLEDFVYDSLLLNAAPAELPNELLLDSIVHRRIDKEQFAQSQHLMRAFFGLLIHAHYRTTASDLQRMMDAPNIDLHALICNEYIVAATMVAREGNLPPELCSAIYWGQKRLRGHALPETLISHSGRQDAGELNIIRSVRIAVHPKLRRRGLGTQLAQAIHETYQPDLFGTIFGLTEDLLRFRRHQGYDLVRIGASRGTRTGEPAAVMLRPVTRAGRSIFDAIRRDWSRDINTQFKLMMADDDFVLASEFEDAIKAGLPDPSSLTTDDIRKMVSAFAYGPRILEAAAPGLQVFVTMHLDALACMKEGDRILIESRLLRQQSWARTMTLSGLNSIPATMRALRRAIRTFVENVDSSLKPPFSKR